MADRTNKPQEESSTGQKSQQTQVARHQHLDPFFYPFGGGLLSASPLSMMRRMFDDFDRIWGGFGTEGGERGMQAWSPAIEISEQNGALVVCAELPGLSKSDVHVEATDDALIIEGERKREEQSEEGGIRRSERSYGRFYRTIPLPEGVRAEEAKAKFNDGVLEVRMPISKPEPQRRQIPLEGETPGQGATSKQRQPQQQPGGEEQKK